MTERSAPRIWVLALELLLFGLGSKVAELTLAVFVTVVPPLPWTAWKLTWKVATAFVARLVQLAVTIPLLKPKLAAGPVNWARLLKPNPAGSGSLRTTLSASAGPRLLTVRS